MVDEVEKEGRAEAGEAGAAPQTAEPGAPPGVAADLEAELAQAKAQADEYLDQWRRAAADLANYRKRIEREREDVARLSNALLLAKLLPVLDDFERAMATLPADLRRFSWVEGVSHIARKLWFTMEAEGVKPIEAAGQPFDPERHEAVLREETATCPDGQVIAELQRGYELHGRVLRPALVKVAAAPAAPGEAASEGPAPGGPPPPAPEA